MNSGSALYVGSVMHRRFTPRLHRFRYRAFWLLLDLSELEALSRRLRFFSHNRFNLLSLRDTDHGDGSATPLLLQVKAHLSGAGIDIEGGSVRLLCMPRMLGYCFNPLSVYFCSRRDGGLAAILYEVHNTFAERHSYLIPAGAKTGTIHQRCEKVFYVSPFLDMRLDYEFFLRRPGDRIAIAIRVCRANRPVMTACLAGTRRPLSDFALLRAFSTIPAVTLKVTLAIYWEALRLRLKGLRFFDHPAPPEHPVTTVPQLPNR